MRSGSGHSHSSSSFSASKLQNLFTTLLLAAFVFVSVSAFAQSTIEGAVGGTVYDQHDAVVAGATVVVHNNGTNAEFKQTTNDSGYFRVTGLTPSLSKPPTIPATSEI